MRQQTTTLYTYFKALANPIRLQIFEKILEAACECNLEEKGMITGNCVSSIAQALSIPQPTVSNHVKELIHAGLITPVKQGKIIYLFGKKEVVEMFKEFSSFIEKEVSGHNKIRI